MKIQFKADKVIAYPILADRSFKVVLYGGEYQKEAAKEIWTLPEGVYNITIEPDVTKA